MSSVILIRSTLLPRCVPPGKTELFPSVSVCSLLFRNTGLNLLTSSKYEDSTKTCPSDTYAEAGVGYGGHVFMELS